MHRHNSDRRLWGSLSVVSSFPIVSQGFMSSVASATVIIAIVRINGEPERLTPEFILRKRTTDWAWFLNRESKVRTVETSSLQRSIAKIYVYAMDVLSPTPVSLLATFFYYCFIDYAVSVWTRTSKICGEYIENIRC